MWQDDLKDFSEAEMEEVAKEFLKVIVRHLRSSSCKRVLR